MTITITLNLKCTVLDPDSYIDDFQTQKLTNGSFSRTSVPEKLADRVNEVAEAL